MENTIANKTKPKSAQDIRTNDIHSNSYPDKPDFSVGARFASTARKNATGDDIAKYNAHTQPAIITDGIDRMVYDLYGLTAEEIKIVEGK